jgi:putative DNA primase/helicase
MNTERPLPSRTETERAILGAILVDEKALGVAVQHLTASDFFVPAHGRIFEEMRRLAESGHPITLPTLCDALEQNVDVVAAGGAAFVAALGDGVHRNAPIESWAKDVRDVSWLRRVAYSAESLIRSALAPSARVEEIAAQLEILAKFAVSRSLSARDGLVVVSAEELLQREIKPREMLLEPILPEQGLAMLYAYRGIGKTFLALGIAAAVTSGTRLLRWNAPRARRVLYFDGELPASTMLERLAMVLAGIEGGEPAPDSLKIITPDLQKRPIPDLATLEGQRLLEPYLTGIDLLVLDNLSALCRDGNENEGEGWLPVQEWALRLRRQGMSVLFVHHAGKNKTQRGTSRREDLLDTVITLKHPPDYDPREGLRCEVSLREDACNVRRRRQAIRGSHGKWPGRPCSLELPRTCGLKGRASLYNVRCGSKRPRRCRGARH